MHAPVERHAIDCSTVGGQLVRAERAVHREAFRVIGDELRGEDTRRLVGGLIDESAADDERRATRRARKARRATGGRGVRVQGSGFRVLVAARLASCVLRLARARSRSISRAARRALRLCRAPACARASGRARRARRRRASGRADSAADALRRRGARRRRSSPSTNGVTSGSMRLTVMHGQAADGFNCIEQQTAAARDARHHGADRNRQHLGDFGVRKFFHIA